MKNNIWVCKFLTEMSIGDCKRALIEEHDVQSQSCVGMYVYLKRKSGIMLSWTLHGIVPAEFRMKVHLVEIKGTTKIVCAFNPLMCNFTCGALYIFSLLLCFLLVTGLFDGNMEKSEILAIAFGVIILFLIPLLATLLALSRMKYGAQLLFKNLLNALLCDEE